jgi:glycosyltransferase involved in cell wall biosynthesis
VQFHVLSFEGPDPYSRAGGLASRVEGLSDSLASLGHDTHLWFVGDPGLPGEERRGSLHLHRWCQWVSAYHPGGVYDGEWGKQADYAASLPPALLRDVLLPHLADGGRAVVLAEEWHTVHAVLHLDGILRHEGLRHRVTIFWNANNVFGFERIPWQTLARAARITTVSRYMKQRMRELGIDALVIPNGLAESAFAAQDRALVGRLRCRFKDRVVLTKMARWDPDKRWLPTIEIVAQLKREGWRPLLVARGGHESHGADVLRRAWQRGLRVVDCVTAKPGATDLMEALAAVGEDADVVNLRAHVDPEARRTLFRATGAVLANSDHEPFGLVGLEAMAAGGLACTGCSGEDYAAPGRNALVLETGDPGEFIGLYEPLRRNPERERAIRRAGQTTARHYAWREVVQGILLPRLALQRAPEEPRRLALVRPRAPSRTLHLR